MKMREIIPTVVELWNAGLNHRQIGERIGRSANYSALMLHYARDEGAVTRAVASPRNERVDVECLRCGHPFSVLPSKYRQGAGKYCSVACVSRYKAAVRDLALHLYLTRRTTRGIARDIGATSEIVRLWIRDAIANGAPDYRPGRRLPIPVSAAGYLSNPPHETSPAPALTKHTTAPGAFFGSEGASLAVHTHTVGSE